MKKIISAILLAVAFQAAPVQAGLFDQGCCDTTCCDPCCDPCCCEMGPITLEARFAALFLLDRKTHRNYHKVLPNFELQVATTWCNWQPWFNAGYIWDNGRRRDCFPKSRLQIVPLSLGVNYLFPMCNCIDAYIGVGGVYSFLRTNNHDDFVRRHVNRHAWGATVKAGFYYNYSECVFFEGFVDYVYARFKHEHHRDDVVFVDRRELNLNAIKLGVGVGFKF